MGIKKTRNRIERWFRKLKERTKRFNNNINTKSVKNVEEMTKAIALLHNITTQTRNLEGVILT
jgi:transposase-like protein